MPPMQKENRKAVKHKRDSEGSNRLKKKPQSGRSISQQLYNDVFRGILWDDDLSGAPTGLNKEDKAIAHEMKSDMQLTHPIRLLLC